MAIEIFPQKLQNLWQEWNLRVAVLISLSFQIILIFFASERKRTGKMLLHVVIWSSYIVADWFAAVAVGLISSNQGDNKCENGTMVDNDLTAFWAPFLLLHLGGPDTITAFSLEDNDLWLRHMIGVVIQVLAVLYVFIQSLPNRFWLPTALMFFAGTVKYAERTRALYLASSDKMKNSVLDSMQMADPKLYEEYMEEYYPNQAAAAHRDQLPADEGATANAGPSSSSSSSNDNNIVEEYEIIERAYWLYNTFRGLIVEGAINIHERIQSRKFFKRLNNAGVAFKIVEVELNFMYDELYTKMAALHYGVFWYVLSFVCTTLLVAAFSLFAAINHSNKSKIHRLDMAITYVLLIGAVILDLVSLVKLVFSGWTVALLVSHYSHPNSNRASRIMQSLLEVLKVKAGALARIIPKMVLLRKRWCGCLYQLSMINYCLKKRYEIVEKTAERFQVKEILDVIRYRREQKVDDGLRESIFKEMKAVATMSSSAQPPASAGSLTYSSKGEYVLVSYGCPSSIQETLSDTYTYDQSVMIWHIATDICFYGIPHPDMNIISSSSTDQNRSRCKNLSDYLVYILIMQPEILSRLQDLAYSRFYVTSEIARKFLNRAISDDGVAGIKLKAADACEKLLESDPETIKMEEEGSVLSQFSATSVVLTYSIYVSLLSRGVRLAKDLKNMLDENRERTWEMMSKAWLQMLLYGSMVPRGTACAHLLNHGGELVLLVWLCHANFGFGMPGSSHVRQF